jgi:hypothetical protein
MNDDPAGLVRPLHSSPEVASRELAHSLRGPWWWRWRCQLADVLSRAAFAVDPWDRSSMYWYSDDRETVSFARIRRRDG